MALSVQFVRAERDMRWHKPLDEKGFDGVEFILSSFPIQLNCSSSNNDQEAEDPLIGFRSGLAVSQLSVQGRNAKSMLAMSTSQLVV